ncbi:hypothetical protein A5703_09925 [Mycobacterium sp. E188]|nr:hypothetical protein A5703_09925 [Mycobacterium sp. E188]OBH44583.1 hypothetical protein A5691_01365 [Mycobacterium sp. E183]
MQRAFYERCKWVELMLGVRALAEIKMGQYNFSAGLPIEAIFREELAKILPRRYEVTCGAVSDRDGNTAGDCDVVIFNDTWFPLIKPPPTTTDRQRVMPVEGAYAVLEVKQSLSISVLDAAMAKLVTCSRLRRPVVPRSQVTENRRIDGLPGNVDLTNPLFTAVVGIRLADDSLNELVARFIKINQRLHPDRDQMVHCLCVLGEACFFWGWVPEGSTQAQIAKFMGPDDRVEPLMLIESSGHSEESPLGTLVARLYGHATNSILEDPTDLPNFYGIGQSYKPYQGGLAFIPQVDPIAKPPSPGL